MTVDRRPLAAILAALALTLGAAACGDDDDGSDVDTTIPEVTIPEELTTTPEETTTSETQTTEDVEEPTKTFDPEQDDSPTNDKPPAPGSPEEAFEKDCAANPGKCG